jgi:flavin prenyltransferase
VSNPTSLASLPAPILPIVLGVTGASGLIYAVRAVKFLLEAGYSIELVASKSTYMVWQSEQDIKMPVDPIGQEQFWRQQAGVESLGKLTCHPWGDVGANIASGSFRTLGMIVIPCSMSTAAKLAAGLSSDLLERAADVQLKEGRKLVIVPRETPFSLIKSSSYTRRYLPRSLATMPIFSRTSKAMCSLSIDCSSEQSSFFSRTLAARSLSSVKLASSVAIEKSSM